jgi:Fe-S-cluster-containing dehydrogenase component
MKKWNMIVDVARCHNCYNCFITTKDEYVEQEHKGYTGPQPLHGHSWVDMEYRESGEWPIVETNFRPVMCNHCDDAPCMKAATGDAIKKRDDGIVIIDPKKSKGQKQIVDACPYGAIYWNEEEQIPQAWPFDAHLLDQGWEKTKIEISCPTEVLKSVKVTDKKMQQIAKEENLTTLEPRMGAKPRVYYKNIENREECLEGVTVTAVRNEETIGSAVTDGFGEFKIEKIYPDANSITLKVEHEGKIVKTLGVPLEDSTYIGCIEI